MIKVFLIALLLVLFAYAISQRSKSGPIALFIMVCCGVGIAFVAMPDLSTTIANAMGVGRGADLVTYLIAIVVLAGIFNLHLRLRSASETTTELARRIAILSARSPARRDQA